MQTDARGLTLSLGGKWHGRYGVAPCPVCQPEGRRGQDALTLTDGDAVLLLNCKKSGCAFHDILVAAGIMPGSYSPPDPAIIARREAERRAEAAKRERQARAIWAEALPIDDTSADLEALGPEPVAPPSADRVVTEPTWEGLTRLFVTGQPSLALMSDEGGQFLGGHAMNSDNRQKTLAALNDLWTSGTIRRTRAGDGHATLYGRRLAVHLMVQPGVARAFMSDPMTSDTGFLPRFLMCEPPSAIGFRPSSNSQRDDAALARYSQRLRAILATPLPMEPETRELKPRHLPLAPDARIMLTEFADAIEAAQRPGGDLEHITGTASKAAEQAARIAGVLTLWRNLQAAQVEAGDIANAITLAQFYLAEGARLASAATVSAEVDRAEALRRWLQDWPHAEVMTREVVQRGPGRLRESRTARAALQMLEAHGHLVALDAGAVVRGAARKEAWRVVRGPGDVV